MLSQFLRCTANVGVWYLAGCWWVRWSWDLIALFVLECLLRGGVKIENQENVPEMSQFQFGNFENRGGGSLFFKNVPISII